MLPSIVIQSEAKNLGNTHYYATEILPPFGRLNDKQNTRMINQRKSINK